MHATPVRAVIFDWAGTLVDYGSRAPVAAFQQVFRLRGVEAPSAAARAPMGLAKREHLAHMLQDEDILADWRRVHGGDPSEADLDALYADFLPVLCDLLPHYSGVLPGVGDALAELRRRGLALGSTTGYSRTIMDIVEPLAAQQGLLLDCVVCADQVPAGRPKPWMLFQAAQALDAFPPAAVVNVDDTPAGVASGRNAGMWSIGVTRTGNELGLSEDEIAALDLQALEERLAAARARLLAAGAHDVIESVSDLPALLAARALPPA
ncbi:MAG: phosphonoacetaldehyde hydrolase [Acidobacteria bacterium]|nr:phosphonoacetaldehyde hydrolase [Acidobacteriota bacterium]